MVLDFLINLISVSGSIFEKPAPFPHDRYLHSKPRVITAFTHFMTFFQLIVITAAISMKWDKLAAVLHVFKYLSVINTISTVLIVICWCFSVFNIIFPVLFPLNQ